MARARSARGARLPTRRGRRGGPGRSRRPEDPRDFLANGPGALRFEVLAAGANPDPFSPIGVYADVDAFDAHAGDPCCAAFFAAGRREGRTGQPPPAPSEPLPNVTTDYGTEPSALRCPLSRPPRWRPALGP